MVTLRLCCHGISFEFELLYFDDGKASGVMLMGKQLHNHRRIAAIKQNK